MTTSIRIQRSRQRKQVSPNGLPIKYVGRPGKWGNPFILKGNKIYLQPYQVKEKGNPDLIYLCPGNRKKVVALFELIITNDKIGPHNNHLVCDISFRSYNYLVEWIKYFKKIDWNELKDKNLSCWCKLTDECHADVYLKKLASL